ncbi:MAG: D-2-hydroxyacid dehydrogenase [Verrucomicrobiae bacterium]|nr:D-2-hydroxyacid dehydrogenase [Verrucomicrobiae bacterium]
MKIVVLDGRTLNPGDLSWEPLRGLGTLEVHDRTTPSELTDRISRADVILTNKVRLPAEALAQTPARLVSVLATGYDVVDIAAARSKGITVTNVAGYSTASTAQLTVALLLELTHRVGLHDQAVHAGEWVNSPDFCFWKSPLMELDQKTFLLVGAGTIGRRVAAIVEAMGMKVVAAELAGRSGAGRSDFPRLPFPEALAEADVISLHCPLTPQTRHLIDAGSLARFKKSAFLINASRGGLIDEAALAVALQSGQLAGFACDVLSTEPPAADNPLLTAPRTVITPHIAWASRESRTRLLAETAENIRAFQTGQPRNVVT